MFDYVRKLQLAVSDMGRRVGLKAAAGVVALVAAGFLIAALWTFIARTLEWGPLAASLIIGVLFGVVAAVLLSMSNNVKHPVPSTDELKREVEARAKLASEAAMDKAKEKAREVVDMAENKVHGLIDTATYKASSLVDDAEARVQTFTREAVSSVVHKTGLDSGVVDDVKDFVQDLRSSRAGPAVGVLGAFAVGLGIAAALGRRDHGSYENRWDGRDWAEDDWSDDQWSGEATDEEYSGA